MPRVFNLDGRDRRVDVGYDTIYALIVREDDDWSVFPRASYLVRDDLGVWLRYLTIGGPRESLLGQSRSIPRLVTFPPDCCVSWIA